METKLLSPEVCAQIREQVAELRDRSDDEIIEFMKDGGIRVIPDHQFRYELTR